MIRPYKMKNVLQHYAWGMTNNDAIIAELLSIKPEQGLPYAELWMGDHPNGPSRIYCDHSIIPLSDLIQSDPRHMLGVEMSQSGHALPFLFKVLSAGAPLSIQLHPNREQASVLNARDPVHYPDKNHKPEIAIALDELVALVGLKPAAERTRIINEYPEILEFISRESRQPVNDIDCLIHCSQTDPAKLVGQIQRLKNRLQSQQHLTPGDVLFLQAQNLYPEADIGLFMIYFLNLITLKRGEAIFIDAGVPHAYIHGNIIECMANSDNVVRAGLTPKFRDIGTLLEIMNRNPYQSEIIPPDSDRPIFTYPTPAEEFEVSRCLIQPGQDIALTTRDKPMILIMIEGNASLSSISGEMTINRGESFFIPAALERFGLHSDTLSTCFIATIPKSNPT